MNSPAAAPQGTILSATIFSQRSPSDGRASEKPLIGRDAHKHCDREAQKTSFWMFFHAKSKTCPRQPQFYWLHGEADECLDSFIDSLSAEVPIKSYVSLRKVNIPWPRTGSLGERKEMLAFQMCEPFRLNDIAPEQLAETLCQRCLDWKSEAVILSHDIHAADWNAQNKEFVCWYISECWGSLKCRQEKPQFLIFFNMIYPARPGTSLFSRILRRRYSKKQIIEQLRQLHEHSGDPCEMLAEFRSVERQDVHCWLNRYANYCDEPKRLDILDRLFQEQGRSIECRPMRIVQKALEEFVKEQERVMMEREGLGHVSQTPSSPPPLRLSSMKRKALEQNLERYQKQYEAVSQQKRHDLNAGNQVALQDQLDELEQKIRDIEQELGM